MVVKDQLPLAPPPLVCQESEKHSNLAVELVDSEVKYVNFLRSLSDSFYARLKAMGDLDKLVRFSYSCLKF